MTRAYGLVVVGGGSDRADATAHPSAPGQSNWARGHPNWWVILAVSLALMALLVATSGGKPVGTGHRALTAATVGSPHSPAGTHAHGVRRPRTPTTTTMTTMTTTATTTPTASTTTTSPRPEATVPPASGSVLTGASNALTNGADAYPTTTTTTTTVPAQAPAAPANGTQDQGYLDPPLEASNQFGFTGSGPMVISVVWSGDTYLTMAVSCPSGGDDVGGTSGMEASLDASGSCIATVTEPSSESTSLTYTITFGPTGG